MKAKNLLITCLILTGCATQESGIAELNVGGKNIIGADFYLCRSSIKWDGLNINIEGLDIDPTPATKSFKVAKVGLEAKQIRSLENLALGLDRWYTMACTNANRLHSYPTELRTYLGEVTAQTQDIMQRLIALEQINLSSNNPKEIEQKQEKVAQEIKAIAPT